MRQSPTLQICINSTISDYYPVLLHARTCVEAWIHPSDESGTQKPRSVAWDVMRSRRTRNVESRSTDEGF